MSRLSLIACICVMLQGRRKSGFGFQLPNFRGASLARTASYHPKVVVHRRRMAVSVRSCETPVAFGIFEAQFLACLGLDLCRDEQLSLYQRMKVGVHNA